MVQKKFSLITSIDLKVNFRDMLGSGACITGMLRDKKCPLFSGGAPVLLIHVMQYLEMSAGTQ